MTAIFTSQYKYAYQTSTRWTTLIDEVISGGEQRHNLWTQPKRSWTLEFEKDNTDTNSIMSFFNARRGRFEAFYWTWLVSHPADGRAMGGDGVTYLVRFDEDELNIKHVFAGYTTFSIKITEVSS